MDKGEPAKRLDRRGTHGKTVAGLAKDLRHLPAGIRGRVEGAGIDNGWAGVGADAA
jgi:hypothetical protein